jgi:acyl-coenzyme A synthetase/AMP-(fatty) acid ligase
MTFLPLSRLLAEGREPSSPVATTGGRLVDFARLHADVAANSARIRASGCKTAVLATRDGYWAAVGLLALWHAGATAVLSQSLRPGSLEGVDFDTVVCDELPEGFTPRVGQLPILLAAAPTSVQPLAPFDAAAARVVLHTSGSTGTAKPVVKTAAMLEREAIAVDAVLSPRAGPLAWVRGTVAHQHLYGLTFRLVWPLSTGRPFVGAVHDYWESVFAETRKHDVLVTSPSHLTRLADAVGLHEGLFAVILSAGAPLPETAAQTAVSVFGVPVTEMFGSTENGCVAWRARNGGDPAWQPFPGVDVGRLPDGRMTLRSPFMTRDAVDAEWQASADLIELHAGGRFRFLGRVDRIVKVEGNRISLPEIETRLKALDLVLDAAVVRMGDDQAYLGGVVVPSEAGATRLSEIGPFRFGRMLRRALAANHEPTGLPRKWRFVASIPTGTLGKRRDAELVALFASRPMEPELRARREIDGGVELDLFISPDLVPLEGHFPGLPIVPGVAQIDWVVKLAARHLSVAIETAQAFQVKFRSIIQPGITVTLTMRRRSERNQIEFEYRHGPAILSSGTVARVAS